MIKYIIIIIIGIIEAFGSTLNSKFRQRSKKIGAFITAFINILVWYYIVSMIIENINNIRMALVYALFYSGGDILALYFDDYLEIIAKQKGFKRKLKKFFARKK